MATSFREKLRKIVVACLASLMSIIVVIILAIIIFASNPIGAVRGCYIFLKTKITEE